jgi:hypothetical protein
MQRPRIQICTMMVGVAVVAVVLGSLIERHRRFKRIAADHFPRSGGLGVVGFGGAGRWVLDRESHPIDPSDNDRFDREWGWHRELWQKYEQAARQPWLHVETDPPKPE